MTVLDYTVLCNRLLDAYDNTHLTPNPSSEHHQFNLAEAYAVAAHLTDLRRERGEQPVGRKIGFTNRGIWEAYGIERPLWAPIYSSTVRDVVGDAAVYSLAKHVAPQIEPEIVLGLRAPLLADTTDAAALLDAVAWVAFGFEIVDCHYANWKFTLADAVADFGLHGALLVSSRLAVQPANTADLLSQLTDFKIRLLHDDQEIATGTGADVLGGPLLALGHLAATLREQPAAPPLEAGELITSGTLTPAFPVTAGETWTVEITGIDLKPLTLRLQ
ncbi:MAG: hydratase [Chloroflexaceae bacterium]|nr:hydratase [Chloroflexaceae bacterium]NJO07461.1 hydratase [Chloroflexaceae bacterium]NJO84971.1 hydratase [Blastochloris sp.]